MVKKASNPELKKALNEHLQITKAQKQRLDQVKQLLEKEMGSEKSEARI